jgi:RNA polymerase sigma-70 factor (ECF subfamily)
METQPTSPEALLAHADFVRGLAHSLVYDPGDADDLAQQAWLAALERPPRHTRKVQGWFATVLRRLNRHQHRRVASRTARESTVARPEGTVSAVEVVAREEMRRAVVEAVQALAEPYRGAVLLRYYEDLPPREIALRQGAPVETVKTRIKRGLAQLRERLDAAHAGDRRAWAVAFAVIAAPSLAEAAVAGTSGTVAGGVAMTGTAKLGVAAVVAVALAAGGVALVGGGRDTATSPRSAELDAMRRRALRAEQELHQAAARRTADTREWEARAAEFRAEKQRLEAELAALRAKDTATADTGESSTLRSTFRFGLGGKTPAFDRADWPRLGSHMSELARVMAKLAAGLSKGESPDPATRRGIATHDAPLTAFALKAAAELGCSTASEAYTHPAVIANLMRAALQRAGHPLTPEQEFAIEVLGEAWAADVTRLKGTWRARTLALQKTVDEVDAKQRFLDSARKLLTAAQQAALSPPEATDRAHLDLLSPALMYSSRVLVTAATRVDLESKLAARALAAAGLPSTQAARHEFISTAWLDALPPEHLEPLDRRDLNVRFPHVSAIQAAARAQIAAVETLLALGDLTETQAAQVRENKSLSYPVLLKTE